MKTFTIHAVIWFALAACAAAQAAVTISTHATKNMSCSGGVCSPTAKNAFLSVADLENMLAAGDTKVTTGSSAVTVEISAPLTWASAHTLTLDANLNVDIKAAVIVEGTAGLDIVTSDGGSGGDVLFFPGGRVQFWDLTSALVINGKSYALVGDIATLASDIAATPSGAFALANDYDASGDGTYTAAAVPTSLTGAFEGLGNTISNLVISQSNNNKRNIGLFADVNHKGMVRDITVGNVQVSVPPGPGLEFFVGGLVGEVGSGGLIFNAHVTGSITGGGTSSEVGGLIGAVNSGFVVRNSDCDCTVSGKDLTGGIAGYNQGSIVNSHSSGSVAAQSGTMPGAGGLVGWNVHLNGADGTIQGSYSTSTVNATQAAGLVWKNDNGGIITSSYATGSVTSPAGQAAGLVYSNETSSVISNSYATGDVHNGFGGLAGGNSGTITACFATGSVDNPYGTAGGFVGGNESAISLSFATGAVTSEGASGSVGGFAGSSEGTIQNSYALGNVTASATESVGGLVGFFDGGSSATISDSYSIGLVSGGRPKDQGGMIGQNDGGGPIVNSYWDRDTSGKRKSAGGVRLTDAQLKSALPDGFDSSVWGLDAGINNGYPYLLANPPK
jgi:hypothetical protein